MDKAQPCGAMILFFLNKVKKMRGGWVRTETCTHAQAHKFSDSYIATQFIQFHDKRIVLIITFTSVIVNCINSI